MANINVNARSLREFLDSLIMWQECFNEITYSYDNIKKRINLKKSEIKEKNNRILQRRRDDYIKAVEEYTRKSSEIMNCSSSGDSDNNYFNYDLLKPYQDRVDTCSKLLKESENIDRAIDLAFNSFEDIYRINKEEISKEIDFLEDCVKKSNMNLSEFADITQKSEEETNQNGIDFVSLKTVNGISSRLLVKTINSSHEEYLTSICKYLKKDNQRFQFYKDDIRNSEIQGLSKTNQQWHQEGDFTVFNTPKETGEKLDSAQGKLSNFLGTCGCVSCVNVLRLAGLNVTEEEIVGYAATHDDENGSALCTCGSENYADNGATSALDRQHILEAYGVKSELVEATIDNIVNAVIEGKGVIASVHADFLYNGKIRDDDLHAVTITSVKYKDGKPYSIITCDSNGRPNAAYYYTTFKNALTGNPLNVTSKIIR